MSNNIICIDASFLVCLITSDSEDTPFARLWQQWQTERRTFVAPNLLYYEITNAIYRSHKAKQITSEEAKQVLEDIFSLDIILYDASQLPRFHQQAFELAENLGLAAAYDAHYLVVAERLEADFYTADRRLYNSVKNSLSWVYLVESM